MEFRHTLLLFAITAISLIDGKRILVLFYHPGPTHFSAFYPLFNTLAERGHNVTVLSYVHVDRPHKNYNEFLLPGMFDMNSSISYDTMLPFDRSIYTMHMELYELYNFAEMEREAALRSPYMDHILATHKEQPFDVVLVELFITDFMLGLIHQLNVPFIGFSTCALPSYYYDIINQPDIPSYIPFAFSGFSWDMNIYERTINWITTKSMKLLYRFIQRRDNEELQKRFGNGIPDVADIAKNMSLVLVNQHYSFTGPKPLSSQLIEVGGLHLKPLKPIPKKLKEMLDNATQGVILVSWGATLKSASIPDNIRQEMIRGFAKLPQLVLWKWEDDAIKEIVSKNVYATTWLPQQEILCHPNVKLFWAHGGNSGTIETVHCGKPAIFTPFYGDQYLNAAALEKRGMGFVLPLSDITADRIYNIVNKALEPKVYEMAQKVSYEYRNRLASPLDTAVWWVEHVIATNGYELGKSRTFDMHWFVYHSVDVVVILLCLLVLFVWLLKLLITAICCRKSQSNTARMKKLC